MLEGDELVFHAMHQEGGAADSFDLFNILEPILNEVLEYTSRLVLCDSPDALEATHQQQTTRLPDRGYMCRWTTAHTPPKYDDVLLLDA